MPKTNLKRRKIRHKTRTQLRKHVEKGTAGKCAYCHKYVKNLEAHIKSKHRGEKPVKI